MNEARDILSELTRSKTTDVVLFGTEAGIFRALGMSMAVCGPGSIEQAHTPNEFLATDQLKKCFQMLEGLKCKLTAWVANLCGTVSTLSHLSNAPTLFLG